jgi:hypothetical protein
MRRHVRLALFFPLLCASLGSPLFGQFQQYTAPGGLAGEIPDRRAQLEKALKESRWHLGPIRVDPWIALRELSYVRDDRGEARTSDVTATVGAGVRFVMPAGGKSTFAGHILPQYVWWRDRSEARTFNGRYGLGWFFFSHRLKVDATASDDKLFDYVTSQVARRTEGHSRRVALDVEVPVTRRFAVYGRASQSKFTASGESDADFLDLDRDENVTGGGIRWRSGERFLLGLGASRSKADFAGEARDRSNSGRAVNAELAYSRRKFQVSIGASRYDLDARSGSEFGSFRGTAGTARVAWRPREKFGWSVYGYRQLVYTIDTANPYFLDQRLGTAVDLGLGHRLRTNVFYESGQHRFAAGAGAPERTDDASAWGGGFDFEVGRGFRLNVAARRTTVDAPLGQAQKTWDVHTGLVFSGSGGDNPWF